MSTATATEPTTSPHTTNRPTIQPTNNPTSQLERSAAQNYRLGNLVPPPRKHRHREHGVFAPNHKLRRAVTALAIGNIGKRREAATGGDGGGGHATEGYCDANQKPRSHDTSRIAWAKLMARMGEEFPLECPNCGGDIRLIAFITEPGPIRKILTHLLLHTERRTARTAADLARSWPAH